MCLYIYIYIYLYYIYIYINVMFLYIFGVPFFRVLLSRRWAQLERGSLRMLADEAAAVAAIFFGEALEARDREPWRP